MEYIQLTKEVIRDNLINLSQLTFEVTDSCNLKCKYCGYGELYGDYDERTNKKLSVKKAINLLEYLCKCWRSDRTNSYRKNIHIGFYGGEPLLNMDFVKEIVSWIEKVNISACNFLFAMTTNGILIDRYIDYLVQHDFHVLISLDGNKEDNGYRVDHFGKSSFERVYHNVMGIKTSYPFFFEHNVSFSSVLHNKNDYSSIVEFFQKEFGKIPFVSELNSTGIRFDKKDEYIRMYNSKLNSINSALNSEKLKDTLFMDTPETAILCSYIHSHSGNVFQNYKDLLLDGTIKRWFPTGTCLPFGRKLFVTVNGRILPCERVSHEYSLGFVDELGVFIDLDEVTQKYNSWYDKYVPQCSKCYNNNTCKHCMFYNSDLNGKAKCDAFMDKLDFERYREDQLCYLSEHPSLYKKIMTEVVIH